MRRGKAPVRSMTESLAIGLLAALLATAGCSGLLGIGNLDVVDDGGTIDSASSGSGGGGSSSGSGGGSGGGSLSSSGGGSGGSSGSGSGSGSGGDASSPDSAGDARSSDSMTPREAASGACTDSADMAIENQSSFKENATNCAIDHLAEEPATLDCLEGLGISDACALCYDALLQCSLAHCASPCSSNIAAPACVTCELANCDSFQTCSGLTP
jgi:hypothetical protein